MKDLVGELVPFVPSFLLRHKFRSDLQMPSVQSPVLLVHGTHDRLIPMEQSKRLFEAANTPKVYQSFKGSDHNTLVVDGLFQDAVWPFLEPLFGTCDGLRAETQSNEN